MPVSYKRVAAVGVFTLSLLIACGGTPAAPATNSTTKTSAPVATVAAPSSVAATIAPGATIPPGATPASSGAAVGVCALLTPAEINAATGLTYLDGTLDLAGQCEWNTNASGANSGDLIIAAIQTQDLAFTKSTFGTGGTDVTVAGHAGFYNPAQGLNSLWVDIGGGQLLILSFPRSGDLDPSYQAIAITLAR